MLKQLIYPMSAVSLLTRNTWNNYCSSLERRPILTKSLTAALGFALGDIIAQHSTRSPGQKYDYWRTARMTTFGIAFAGPLQGHFWYRWLDKSILPHKPKSMAAVVSKVCVDQSIMAPLGTAAFFAAMKAMEMRSEEIMPTLEERVWPTVAAGWKLWIPAHAINFGFVPSSQRVLYVNIVAIAWTYILSKAAAGGAEEAEAEHAGA